MLDNIKNTEAPTTEMALSLMDAFNHFNYELFEGRLPAPMFVYQRKTKARGHFWGGIWENGEQSADEISLNPDLMKERTERDILSTLVHEMCHQLQHHFGKPSRSGYHNKEWAEMMRAVGLEPSSTAAPGGKPTGQKVSHYIPDNSIYDSSFERLAKSGWAFPWKSIDTRMPPKPRKSSKVKFTCGGCDANAWGKPDLIIHCGPCEERMWPADQN